MSRLADPEEYKVEGKAGVPVTLPISSGPATGYHWEFELPDGVERYADVPVPLHPHVYGAPGGNIRLKAVRGEHLVTARLIRPWNPHHPIRTARIHLSISSE